MKEFLKKYRVIIACLGFIILGGFCNGVMDKLQFHYSQSIFPQDKTERFLGGGIDYWNPDTSWKNKYKDWPTDQRPRFFLSKTWLVSLTDGWHLLQTLMLFCFHAAILLPLIHLYKFPRWVIFAALIPFNLLFGLAFSLMFKVFLIDKM